MVEYQRQKKRSVWVIIRRIQISTFFKIKKDDKLQFPHSGETGINALTHADENEWIGFRKGNGCEYGYLWNGTSWNTFEI